MARGEGKRCFGFLSEDGRWAHCTRDEHSGGLTKYPTSKTYAHLLVGNCKCGVRHDPSPDAPTPKLKLSGKTSLVVTYDYRDEQGELLYQACRTNPKRFFLRRPNSAGGWERNVDGVRRVLYRLPELLASDASATVFVCEGEKDVDALIERGLVATTNPFGAKKWRDEYNEHLRGRHVAILPDNDEAGQKHAEQVSKSLSGVAASVRVVTLPGLCKGGDVSDWLTASNTVEQLMELVQGTSEGVPPSVLPEVDAGEEGEEEDTDNGWICAADVTPVSVEWLWKPYIALGKITLFDGDPGVGKSWATCAIAAAVSRGDGLLNVLDSEARTVLMLSAEDGLGDTIRPRLETLGADLNNIILRNEAITFDEAGLRTLEAKVAKIKPGVVIIDPLFAFVGGKVDIYKDNEVRAILTPLSGMAERHHCAIVALRHLTKQQQKAIYAGGGSMAIIGAARSALLFGRDPDTPQVCGFVHAKSNLAPLGRAVGYKIERTGDERGRFGWVSDCHLTAEIIIGSGGGSGRPKSRGVEAEEFLCEILRNGPKLVEEIALQADRRGIAHATLQRAKVNLGLESFREMPGKGKWWWRMTRLSEYEADTHRPLLTDEYVVESDLNPSSAMFSADTQDVDGGNVQLESTHSDEYVPERELTTANTAFTEVKADAQKRGIAEDYQHPSQNSGDNRGNGQGWGNYAGLSRQYSANANGSFASSARPVC
jgi:hypothetical protein